MFTPKFVLHWGLPAHPAKFSPGEALSARSTWPNYIQSEGKDSPLWSTWDRQPSSSWLVWHLMQFFARHFSRTDVFESCESNSQHSPQVKLCVCVRVTEWSCAGNIRQVVRKVWSKLWLLFPKKDHPWWGGDGKDWDAAQIKGAGCLLWIRELEVIILMMDLITD